jgi:tetratricopeptide (TPR) repeat protein
MSLVLNAPIGFKGIAHAHAAFQWAAAAKFEQALAIQFNQEGDRSPRTVLFMAVLANNAGFAYYKMGNYEQSFVSLRQALKYDPKRAVAYLNLGDTLVKLKRNSEARQAFTKYLELAPNSKSASDIRAKLAALPASP